jgi:hypothetical protein
MSRTHDWSRALRVSAVAGLLALAITGSSSVVIAQSGPPLPPFRGLIDHVSATADGRLPNAGVNIASRAISGDGRYVVMDSWTVALVASPSPASLGSTVTMTATATGSNKQPPTGQVTFMLNGTMLGQGTLSTTGSVTAATMLSTSTLPHGTHTVEAVYLGNTTYRASTTSITLVVN